MIGTYLTLLVIFFVDILGIILLGFRTNNIYQIYLTTIFFLLSIIVLVAVYKKKPWAQSLAGLLFLAFLIDLLYIYTNLKAGFTIFAISSLFAAIGFLFSMNSICEFVSCKKIEAPKKPKESKDDEREIKVVPYGMTSEIVKSEPGRFIASKFAKTYHTLDCDWGKRINDKNAVYFNTKQEAKKHKYEPHRCVE